MAEFSHTNSYGREYKKGCPISADLRMLIIGDLTKNGADPVSSIVPRGLLTQIASRYKIARQSVKNIWSTYCNEGTVQPKPLSDRKTKQKFFNDGELEFIETLKWDKPSMNYSEISAKLEQFSTFSTRVPKQRISDALRTRMPSGPFTRKQLRRKPCERFTDENMQYTQYFITYVSQKNPRKLKYFDECGIKLSTSDRTHGHSEKGKRCIEIGKHLNGVNVTLNLLVSLN